MIFSYNTISHQSDATVPIYFREYGITIREIKVLGDTMLYNKSSKEIFKFTFVNTKGKCYCERYINGKIYQKGNYENSLDTLSRYISGRGSSGIRSPITVQKYFEPLKNGEWITYKGKQIVKESYLMGVLQ